ncbi:bifunctional uridylate/adenylate kinase [Coemansia guatemalensis]|uniref:Uridylate kinase n=1 Tax=Coemansia guatemalensis TaxID=2761395 RepID=A0A9W8LRN1_9FUNG|nr:bifunctional uridylate/adenylate kinase [Coemansia guatemalensis]
MYAAALRRALQSRIAVAGRSCVVTRPMVVSPRAYSSQGGRRAPIQTRMGQSSKDKSGDSSSGGSKRGNEKVSDFFGFHPIAVIAALTLLGSGIKLIIMPYWDWMEKENQKREAKKKESEKIRYTDEDIASFPFAQKTVVFVLGGPGSGKGTNSEKLVKDFGFVHLSAGDLLRAEQQRSESQYGELIAHYIREGLIVPHEITIGLLRNAMMDHPDCDRFLIDGFPRNIVQAKAFEDMVCKAKQVLFFECPEATMLERLLDRGKTSGRTDDNIESIKKRFRTYVNDSKPVIDEYAREGKVITVSCKGTVDEVYKVAHDNVAALLQKLDQQSKDKAKDNKSKNK